MLTIYLVTVLAPGEIHSFGLGIRESSHFIRKLLVPGDTSGEQMHRGSRTADFEKSCAGTDMVTTSVFTQIHVVCAFPERIGRGLLRPVRIVQASSYVF